MTKRQFILALNEKLTDLPKKEVEGWLDFYSEIIEDKIEEGLSEEEAVVEIGDIDEIASQIASEIPLTKLVKEKVKPKRRLSGWGIVLIILGAPVWFSLLMAAFAVIFSVYVSIWSVIVSLWAVVVSLIASAVAGAILSVTGFAGGMALNGFVMLSVALVCAGLSIFSFIGSVYLTKGLVKLTVLMMRWLKRCFAGKVSER